MRIGLSKYLANKLKNELNNHLFTYEKVDERCEVIFDRSIGRYYVRSPHPAGGYSCLDDQRTALETLGRIPVIGKVLR